MPKNNLWIAAMLTHCLSLNSYAGNMATDVYQYPFYIGAMAGYGSTTWSGLVPSPSNQNSAISMFTPISVTEGGGAWGFFGGYEFTPFFAVEWNYMRYANATVAFDEMSMFTFLHDGLREFRTRTTTINLMGKIMLLIPDTSWRVYSGAGVGRIHRRDLLNDEYHVTPVFGLGVNFQINPRWMAEIAGNYTAGYGESQLNPAEAYFPFLYSVTFRLAYKFHGF